MQYFQILTCNDTLGTCCSDFGLVTLLNVMRKFFNVFQIIVPIILLIMVTVQLTTLISNPDAKNGTKKLTNKFIAAVVCFLLPVIVDVVMGLMPSDQTFQVGACWDEAKISSEVLQIQSTRYVNKYEKQKSPILINPDEYNVGSSTGSSSSTGNAASTTTGIQIANYAKSFVGQRYVFGGSWNGELPYTGTDCSGFVQGVFRHHGISLPRDTRSQWAAKSTYTLVGPSEIRAGDLVMYNGHVAILTGNGNEIVHAQSTKTGIVLSPDYRTCSSKAILGIMRIKGV